MVLFFILILVFLPKQRIINLALMELKDNKILLSSYKLSNKLFMFDVSNINLYYNGIQSVKIEQIYIKPYLIFDDIIIKDIKIDDSLSQFIPPSIELVKINYNILSPLNITINIYSKLYKIKGKFNILDKKLKLNINVSKKFKTEYPKILNKIKYDKNTKDYIYEYQL
jgi:hypothetical protein